MKPQNKRTPRERWIVLKENDPDQVTYEGCKNAILFREVLPPNPDLEKAAIAYGQRDHNWQSCNGVSLHAAREKAFIAGAQWADTNPIPGPSVQASDMGTAIRSLDGKVAVNRLEPSIPGDIDRLQERIQALEKELNELRECSNNKFDEIQRLKKENAELRESEQKCIDANISASRTIDYLKAQLGVVDMSEIDTEGMDSQN